MNNFKIKFDGEQHQIDANTFLNNLLHTTSIIQEINKGLDSGKKIEIKIKALEKGSFLVDMSLIESALDSLKTLLTKENIEFSAIILSGLVSIIQLKKHLKGKKPKLIKNINNTEVSIENNDGDVLIMKDVIVNIYNNSPIIKDAISQSFETLENDPSIEGYEILDGKDVSLVEVKRDCFAYMAIKSEEINEGERILTEAATLHIVRLSFENNLKWDFYYRGNKIPAKIADDKFYELIDKGESFAKGDILEVELQIHQRWDESVNTFINKSYTVLNILRHLPRNIQQKLDFLDNDSE